MGPHHTDPVARDKPDGAFLVSGTTMLVGCQPDVRGAAGRSESGRTFRETDRRGRSTYVASFLY
jgi:hypothetical protein